VQWISEQTLELDYPGWILDLPLKQTALPFFASVFSSKMGVKKSLNFIQ
jgi:hypothetical protein